MEDFQLVKGIFQDARHRFDSLKVGLNGAYQEENAAVALEAFLLFMEQIGKLVDENCVREALQATSWPGRLESFGQGVYLDGAHNPHAIHRLVEYAHTFSDKRYIVDYTLEQIEQLLDERTFFRVSRNCIANINSIRKISKYFNSRLKLSFQPECPHEVLISRVRVPDFLKWVDGVL